MDLLNFYRTSEEKLQAYSGFVRRIDSIPQFREWYSHFKQSEAEDKMRYFFRGVPESKFRNLTSAQRLWMNNHIAQWTDPGSVFLDMIQKMVDSLGDNMLFEKVFDYYRLSKDERDFPFLSILQHYGAPTPLLDFTYSFDVALFIATEGQTYSEAKSDLDKYFSVYIIDKSGVGAASFVSFKEFGGGRFPKISYFKDEAEVRDRILYLSDFEDDLLTKDHSGRGRPLTTYYNLNILPQEGLFVFNPSSSLSLEDLVNQRKVQDPSDERPSLFSLDIRKDLSEYIRRVIGKSRVNSRFIYPDLKDAVSSAVDGYLNNLIS